MAETTRIHAFGDDALGDEDATGVAALIRTGKISAAEATEAAIARAERVDPYVEAIQLRDFERARRAADAGYTGAFAGVPTFIKDNVDLAGLPTDQGSQAVRAVPAAADGPFVTQLLDQGLVPLGKSRLPEFGFNATTEYEDLPPARN
ncbi:MAG: amidase family protein, partial [Nocardioidaceae bacterium]